MAKYQVWFTKSIDACMTVEANSMEEAKEKAIDTFSFLTDEERHKREDIEYQYGYFEYCYTDKVEE